MKTVGQGQRPRSRRSPLKWLATVAAMALLASTGATAEASTTEPDAAADSQRANWQILKPTNTGIPGDYVYSVAVDAKDRPWVTGDDPIWDEGGLGVKKASTWDQWTNVDGKSPTHEMRSLKFDVDGRAWMASSSGLLTLRNGKVRTVWSTANAPWPTNIVRDFDWDSRGNLWVALSDIATVHGGVARYNGTAWKVWTTANGLPWDSPWDQVSTLEIDDEDNVWIGSPVMGGAMYDGTSWTALGEGSGYWVYDIAIAPNGTPWYGFVGQVGVRTWNGTAWVDRTDPAWGDTDISLVTVDRQGRVWVGRFNGMIYRWSGSGSSWDLVYDPPSLGGHVYGLAFDSANRPYVGGIGGLDRRNDDGTWSVYTTQNTALPSRWIDHIMIDDAGDGWLSNSGGGIGVYDGKRWSDFNPNNWGSNPWPFPTDSVTSTVQAENGTVWASPTNAGVGQWNGRRWKTHLPSWSIESLTIDPDGRVWALPENGEAQRWNGTTWVGMNNPVVAFGQHEIAADANGNVWIATTAGLLRFDGTDWTTYTPGDSGLPGQYVISVTPEPSGDAVWVGTDAGLARFDGTNWEIYTEADGLPADVINSIAIAPNGHVWIGAFDGQTWPYHGGVGVFDGTTWKAYTTANSPLRHNQVEAITVGADGRVWIGTASEGAAIFTP